MDQQQFRQSVGSFVTGVTVLSAVDDANKMWGMTANSFSSVSLEPPLISICVGRQTGSFEVFDQCKQFGVSILASNQQDLAIHFATPLEDKFESVELREPSRVLDAPTLKGAAAWLECTVQSRLSVGDHIVLIGRVEACGGSGHPALGYFRGSFFDLAPALDGGTETEAFRRVTTGWLIEHKQQVVLSRSAASGGLWSVPTGPMHHATSTAHSLMVSAKEALGGEVAISFLYSVLDDREGDATCFVYRGTIADVRQLSRRHRLFPLDALPWEELSPHIVQMLRRYVEERQGDKYGIFLSIGPGRFAKIDRGRDWHSAIS